jgi:hypothetical protein
MLLLNPKKHARPYPDERSREVMLKTIEFFERKGKGRIKQDYHAQVWYADFLDFVKEEKIFATMCTPAGQGALLAHRADDECRCQNQTLVSGSPAGGLKRWMQQR